MIRKIHLSLDSKNYLEAPHLLPDGVKCSRHAVRLPRHVLNPAKIVRTYGGCYLSAWRNQQMPEAPSPNFEKMSHEEIAEIAGAIQEFASTHPWGVLKGITGLGIERESVEEHLSNRKPPKEIAPDAEIIAIDECLGLYRPRRKQIVLFQRGIEAAAKILNCEVENLRHVVRYHEWGHATLHVGVDKDGGECDLGGFNRIDGYVHESLAQLLAWRAIVQNLRNSRNARVQRRWERIQEIFTNLEARQPSMYRNWRRLEKVPLPRLQKVLILIRRGTRFGEREGLSAVAELE